MRNAALALLAATMLTGCVNLAPKHTQPALPTDAHYPEGFANDVTLGQRATEIAWRDFFADPQLEALIARAIERNRDLAIAVAQIEEARGQYRIQDADRLPTVGASAEAMRSRSASLTGPGTDTSNRYSVGVGVTSFELDFWGRVKNLSEAARSQYLATQQAERAFRLTLVRDVASTYFASRGAEEQIKLAEATVTSRREGLRIAKLRLDAGVTSALDYRQSETLLTQAETQLASLNLAKAQADNFLAVLVGGPLPADLPAPLALVDQSKPPALTAGLPSELLVARPDIIGAEEQLRAARANVGAARAAFFPSISLTGNIGFASNSLDGLFTNNGLTWSFGPSITLPIFDFGRNKGNLTVAEARENIAVASYEKTVQTAFREVADALAGRRYLAEQVEAQERGTLATRRIADLARKRYREGVSTYLEVLDAERNLFASEQALIEARRAQVDNLVTLYVALGGGMVERR
ncbi:efflux transporter outer membrane subunit [Sphingopyxis sp. BSN-002]|uniref:efflux transporter outer membrane subunit n=1 Tax=Sphingopyxis sp. BSN-002 TaxID=2911495 RepID=UPI001EDBEF3F|nr:efflux transporter outer membrane subunit [Sphingopyxis sp. BSN-002]UKK86146.1 efflux transporter outer membrane subunit [Sphingopyxis sp. BSN-002]